MARERAAVLWAEHVAKNTARDRDDVAAEVKRHFSDAEFVELTAVCGLFGQSNRFQDSMRLPIEAQHDVDKIRTSVRVDPARLRSYLEQMIASWPDAFPPASAVTRSTASNGVPRGDDRGCRVPLIDASSADGNARRFIAAAKHCLAGRPTR
jgi:hypothetical protein